MLTDSIQMARRKSKRSPRKRFTGVNVLNLAEAYALTGVWTEAAFNTSPIEFLTGRVGGKYNPGRDGSAVITLPELLGAGPGGVGGNFAGSAGKYDNLQNSVASNIGGLEGLVMPAFKTAGISIAFKLAKKVTRKPRSMLNSQLRAFGIGDMVRV